MSKIEVTTPITRRSLSNKTKDQLIDLIMMMTDWLDYREKRIAMLEKAVEQAYHNLCCGDSVLQTNDSGDLVVATYDKDGQLLGEYPAGDIGDVLLECFREIQTKLNNGQDWFSKYPSSKVAMLEKALKQELDQANDIIAKCAKGMSVVDLGFTLMYNGKTYPAGTAVIARVLDAGSFNFLCGVDEWPELAAWLKRQTEEQS